MPITTFTYAGIFSRSKILHRGFSSDFNLTQLYLASWYTMPLFRNTQLQLKEGAKIGVPFNQPFYNKKLFGYGDIFMRGYEYYVIDGVAGIVGRATLQHQFLSFTARLAPGTKKEINLPFRFYAKAYSDVGYAYDKNPGTAFSITNCCIAGALD